MTFFLKIRWQLLDTKALCLPTSDLLHGTRSGKYKFSMDNLKPLYALNVNGDIAENWRRWKQRWSLFVIASGAHEIKHEHASLKTYKTASYAIELFVELMIKISERDYFVTTICH